MTHQGITRGLCLTCVEEMMSKLEQQPDEGARAPPSVKLRARVPSECSVWCRNAMKTSWSTCILSETVSSVLIPRNGFGFAERSILCWPDPCSLAGEFFPEAAQIAYKMWELSAMTKVQVWAPSAPTLYVSLHVWLGGGIIICWPCSDVHTVLRTCADNAAMCTQRRLAWV